MDTYLAQKDVRPSSRKAYRKALLQFFEWVEATGRTLSSLTAEDIINFREDLLANNRSSLTTAMYIVSIRGFYEWAEAQKLYPNIARSVKASHDKGIVKMHLTEKQASDLLAFEQQKSPRNYAMINLMLRTGLRTAEVSAIDIEDIRFLNGTRILWVKGKGHDDKKDFVVLTDAAYGPIKDYLDANGRVSGPLFVCEGSNSRGRRLSTRSVQLICKWGLRQIGLDDHLYSAHSLRHTTGVQILKNGGTMFDVQDVLRHSSPETSQIYVESIKEERRLENPSETLLDKSFNI
jgi:integrase/recombinase XerC/integrase/recombinase XerD